MSERYFKTYGLKTVPFAATGAIDDPKYRVVVPTSALGLIEELGKAVEAGQAELVIVRGVVGSGKTRLLSQLCRMLEARNFGKLEESGDRLIAERIAGLKMRRGFGFNVELDQLDIVKFENRFHDAIIEFLRHNEMRQRFNNAYNSKKSGERKSYRSETLVARKLIADMMDILRSRFDFNYFLICIDEFDIIAPPGETSENYHLQVIEFLNYLNEMSKEISSRNIPVLISLLQTHHANQYFFQYISGFSNATGSRITKRFDITLGYDFSEMRDFVVSRLEREVDGYQKNSVHPFNDEILKVLFTHFADKSEGKVLSLRNVEQCLLRLLELGLPSGKITAEMAEKVAAEYSTESLPVLETPDIPPELMSKARADLSKKLLDKANFLGSSFEKALEIDKILMRSSIEKLETVELNSQFAILRGFYNLVHGNAEYDVAINYVVFKSDVTKDYRKFVSDFSKSRIVPQGVVTVLFSPAEGQKIDASDTIALSLRELEVLFCLRHAGAQIPVHLSREVAFTTGKIRDLLVAIHDVPKSAKLQDYLVRTLAGVAVAQLSSQANEENITEDLDIIFKKPYGRTLSQYLGELEERGLVIKSVEKYDLNFPPSVHFLASQPKQFKISKDKLKSALPEKRADNAEAVVLELGLFEKEGTTLVKRDSSHWATKWEQTYSLGRKNDKLDSKEFILAKDLEKRAKSAEEPFSTIAFKWSHELGQLALEPILAREREAEENKSALEELKEKASKLRFPTDKHLEQQHNQLLKKIEEALTVPGDAEVSALEHEYDILATAQPSTQRAKEPFRSSDFPTAKETMPIEKKIAEKVTRAPKSFEELCNSIKDYSPDVLKPVVFEMVLDGKLRLVGRKLHGGSH
jgi:hypothetical protein